MLTLNKARLPLFYFVVLIAAFLSPGATAAQSIPALSPIESRFNRFYRFEIGASRLAPSIQRDKLVRTKYEGLFHDIQEPDRLTKNSTADVGILFRAASLAAYYDRATSSIVDMQMDLHELEKRSASAVREYDEMYGAYIRARRFAEARIVFLKHRSPEMEPLPKVSDDTKGTCGQTLLVPSSDATMLRRVCANVSNFRAVIVVAHPLCHFCRWAARDIDNDPNLAHIMKVHSLWLEPAGNELDLAALKRWNQIHPNESMKLVFLSGEWPDLKRWDTPTFYFYRDRKLVARFSGWYETGNTPALRTALHQIGLM